MFGVVFLVAWFGLFCRCLWPLFPLLLVLPSLPVHWPHACRSMRPWKMLLFLVLGVFPIGEASNPGPVDHFEDTFTLGTFNPSGLRNKSQFFQSHLSFGDVWTVSETHFYGKDVTRFKAGLRAAKTQHKYCITDVSSLRKGLTSQSSWKGVGVVAKHPTRAIPSSLPQPLQDSGRALLFASLLGDSWITGAVMYGEPNGHLYPSFLRNNEYILHHLVSHVCNLSTGPRFVSGDWNVEQNALPAFDLLRQAGFRDIQDVALERWGCPIHPTCKGKTRKDFMYISPELQELMVDSMVLHDVWPDHSVLVGRFRNLTNAPPLWVWPSPHEFPWPADFGHNVQWNPRAADMTTGYQTLWHAIEQDAAQCVPFPVDAAAFGRAQRLTPKKVKPFLTVPIKLARQGEFQPEYHGPSLRHAQMVRQVRRLQSYSRLAASRKPDLAILRVETWSAVLGATGFSPTFQAWWDASEFKTSSAPAACPCCPPSADVASAMFDSLAMAIRHFETQLRQQTRQYAKFRRDQNPNLVFADIRPPMVPGVDVLLQPIRATVDAVDLDTGQLTLAEPCDFLPEQIISCAGQALQVIHHDTDALWVENPEVVQVGAEVTQTKFVGSLLALEAAFVQAWKDRWMRHAEVPAERWDAIVNFAKRHLPRQSFSWPSLDPDDFKRILRHKKKRTSPGFDGVTLTDLHRMPGPALRAFCDMFEASESHGSWPEQLVQGKVVSLAKVAAPKSPNDFRPITVFSLLYRIWSSFHAKRALHFLDTIMPDSLYGNRPGCHATQVWSKLLWCIEHSYQSSLELTGMVADLQKAFNMLPRVAVFEIAGHLGMPGQVLVAWAGAVTQMKRRFLLRGSLTAGVASVTGFPEGCGLSCVAMLLIDFAFHKWFQVFFPLCTPISYVDDWQLLCPHSTLLEGAKLCLEKFLSAVDLQLDAKKTHAWSLTASGRLCLRQQGFRVVLSSRNLGAHVQYSRKHTNATLMERIDSMQALWTRLRLSACQYITKIRAVLVAAWPRALHAVASTTVSETAFHSLRSGAMRGLDSDGAGCNSWIHLGLIEHALLDPQFWAIIQTFRCARECGDVTQVCQALTLLTTDSDAVPTNSISATLMTRLQTLGWHVDARGCLFDQFGSFSLFTSCLSELVMRAQWAWQLIVAQKVAHRPGFHNLQYADVGDTRSFVKQLGAEQREVFHKCLNGCHITQDGKKYCQGLSEDTCPYCECSDSRYHRFWECERFQAERAQVSPDVLAMVPTLPDFLTGYGWSLRPYTLLQWYGMLCAIEIPAEAPVLPMLHDVHVFTDGSCMNQAFPTCRVASWAVVMADHDNPLLTHVIASGPLPGLLQSSYRAEIFAVWKALSCMRSQTCPVHLWTDCGAVVRRLGRLLAGHEPKINSAHSDLWLHIFEALQSFSPGQVTVTKVAAHQSVNRAQSALEEWCFTHNIYADQAAALAQRDRPGHFWPFFAQHVNATCACQRISREIQQVLLAVSDAAIRDKDVQDESERADLGAPQPVPVGAWTALSALHIPAAAVRRYGDEIVREVLSWFFMRYLIALMQLSGFLSFMYMWTSSNLVEMLLRRLTLGDQAQLVLTLICWPSLFSVVRVGYVRC